jgi:hypothetical protein
LRYLVFLFQKLASVLNVRTILSDLGWQTFLAGQLQRPVPSSSVFFTIELIVTLEADTSLFALCEAKHLTTINDVLIKQTKLTKL